MGLHLQAIPRTQTAPGISREHALGHGLIVGNDLHTSNLNDSALPLLSTVSLSVHSPWATSNKDNLGGGPSFFQTPTQL